LGYNLSSDYLKENLQYYLQRTSHGSTLSRVVHTQLANMIGDNDLSWELYLDALTSDFNDIQGGTTGEGIHAGVMAGTILVALQAYAGVDIRSGMVKINPQLPAHWREMRFNFLLNNNRFFLKISDSKIEIHYEGSSAKIEIEIQGIKHILTLNTTLTINLQ
jgi:trehalose/maltose hydrolase-like predicted phosphorylase